MTEPAGQVCPTCGRDGYVPSEALTDLATVNRALGRPLEDLEVLDTVEGVCALVPRWITRPAGGWTADHRLGAKLLAIRLERRKDSPGGFAQFGVEGASYVQGNWPDVAMFLGLGSYSVGRTG